MYATYEGDPMAGTVQQDAAACFNSCDQNEVRANYDSTNKLCYCYADDQPASYVVLNHDWKAAYMFSNRLPKTTIKPESPSRSVSKQQQDH
jgi:hypothetical protein